MPKLPKQKKESANNAFQILSKKIMKDTSVLTFDSLKQGIIAQWKLNENEVVPPVVALSREFTPTAAWRDFIAIMTLIIKNIGPVTATSSNLENNIFYSFNSELKFFFNATFAIFKPSRDADFEDTLNLSILYYTIDPRVAHSGKIDLPGTILLEAIANTHTETALELIEDGVDLNKYSARYGNNAILLAFSKGYHHVQSELEDNQIETTHNQTRIIDALLAQEKCDVNAVHLITGMTLMHIVCIRGDDPSLIELLIQKGVKIDNLDCKEKMPADYLDIKYNTAQEIIKELTGNQSFGKFGKPQHISMTTTLPTETERNRNIVLIKKIFARVEHENTNAELNPNKRFKR